jgi:hypothetical protein
MCVINPENNFTDDEPTPPQTSIIVSPKPKFKLLLADS